MSTNKIHRDDFLWRWYLSQGPNVPPPKNLCQKVAGAARGFGLWFDELASYRRLSFLVFLSIVAIFVARLLYMVPAVMVRYMADTIIVTAILVAVIGVSVAALKILGKSDVIAKYLVDTYPGMTLTMMVGGGLIGLVFMFTSNDPSMLLMKYSMAVGLGLWLCVMIFFMILFSLPAEQRKRVKNFFETLGAFVAAKWKHVCPPAEPPTNAP